MRGMYPCTTCGDEYPSAWAATVCCEPDLDDDLIAEQ